MDPEIKTALMQLLLSVIKLADTIGRELEKERKQ